MVAQERARRRASAEKKGNGRGGPVLEVRSLKTQFMTQDGVVKAVDDVSFYVMPGETLGVVGESGCGKSMTGLSIMRLIPSPPGKIVDGEILFDGDDILSMTDEQVRSIRGNDIAMIFQDPMTSLNPVLTINRQISEALQLHMGMNKDQARERAIELLKMVGIPERRGAGRPISAPVLRRYAPARDDRDGALVQPEAAHRRRADDRARRDDSGADPRPDAHASERARHRRDHDHPLDGRRRRHGRPRPGHVRRPHRRDGVHRRDLRQSAAPVHGRPAEVDPAPRRHAQGKARADSRACRRT